MLKRKIKNWMPEPSKIKEHKHLRIFGKMLLNPHLWYFNRRKVSKAFLIGLFSAWVPVPFQMFIGALGAILFQANLPLSVALVWITNPLTMPVLYYIAYRIGLILLDQPTQDFQFELSYDWFSAGLMNIWQPFLLGCFVCGVISAILGYWIVNTLWKQSILKQRKLRAAKSKLSEASK